MPSLKEKLALRAKAKEKPEPPTHEIPKTPNGHRAEPSVGVIKKGLRGKLNEAMARRDPKKFNEIERIIDLPIDFLLDPAESEEVSRRWVQAEHFDKGGWRLFDTQTSGIMSYELHGGAFCPIGVGWGKTILALLIASAAWNKGLTKILMFVPTNVYPQLWENDLPAARKRVVITPQFHGLGGKDMSSRLALAKSGRGGVYVMPYSLLSTRDSNELIAKIRPQLIIADEAHLLKNPRAARTKRVLSYLNEMKPEFVAMSGTITDKSIMDYWHLIKAALREKMPLPITQIMAAEWAQVLDAKASPSEKQTGPIRPLVDWARSHFPTERITLDVSGFRRAYRLRLCTTPGVVATGDHEIGTSLMFQNTPAPVDKSNAGYMRMMELIRDVQETWLTPNGDEIEHAMLTHKWLFELTTGFYNELVWPTIDEFSKRRKISEAEAEDILERARDHHAYANDFSRAVREFLNSFSRAGIDTPLAVHADIAKHGEKNVGYELYSLWQQKNAADFEGRPDRDSKVVRVYDYKIRQAIEWAKGLNKGGIIWYWHRGIGEWLAEQASKADIDYLFCPAGDEANHSIIDVANKDRIVIASMSAHGEGKNLQHFQNQFFVQWYRNCKKAEQVLGRLHRNGQEADELIVNTNNTLFWDHENFGASLVTALYVHQSTGNRQKLIYAGYNPLPPVFPPEVLREKGFNEVRTLTKQQREMFEEKFGKPLAG